MLPPLWQPLESLVPIINQPGFTGKQPPLLEAINKVGWAALV